jgi:hypothetical protein
MMFHRRDALRAAEAAEGGVARQIGLADAAVTLKCGMK